MASRTLTTPGSARSAAPGWWPPARASPAPTRRPRRSASGRRRRRPRPPTGTSTRSTPPRSTRCRPGSALLVVQRGPSAGSRFLLDTDVVTAGRHPDSEIFLDDVTVSRRHAEFRRDGDELHGRRRRQPQRHLRQPRPDRRGASSAAATRCRSASTAWSSSPSHARQLSPGCPASGDACGGPASAGPDEHRRGARRSCARTSRTSRISKIRFLEAEGLIEPERTPSGYRKFSHDDVERLRYVLRMQRDHYLPLKVIGEHLDAIDRGLEPPPLDPVGPTVPAGRAGRRRAAQRRVVRAGATSAAALARELLEIAEIDEALLDQLEQYGLVTLAPRDRPLRRRRPGHRADGRASWPTSASSRATCGPSRPPPTARSAWSSRSSRRSSAAATPPPARAEEAVREIAALSVRLHATLVKAGLDQL